MAVKKEPAQQSSNAHNLKYSPVLLGIRILGVFLLTVKSFIEAA